LFRQVLNAPVGQSSHDGDTNNKPRLEAIRDYVLLNAAALAHVSGLAPSLREGVAIARKSIEENYAWTCFQAFKEGMQRAAGVACGGI
jgi:anthranilate phosphoribosyltransferase